MLKHNDQQAVADTLKALVQNDSNAPAPLQRAALNGVSRFEQGYWQHQIMNEAAASVPPFETGIVLRPCEPTPTASDVIALLDVYALLLSEQMPGIAAAVGTLDTTPQLYTTEEAAEYLGLTLDGIKKHIHRVEPDRRLRGIERGGVLVFTREALDAFNSTRRPAGRPKQSAAKKQDA